jgi:hypothetical protein
VFQSEDASWELDTFPLLSRVGGGIEGGKQQGTLLRSVTYQYTKSIAPLSRLTHISTQSILMSS